MRASARRGSSNSNSSSNSVLVLKRYVINSILLFARRLHAVALPPSLLLGIFICFTSDSSLLYPTVLCVCWPLLDAIRLRVGAAGAAGAATVETFS
jgi:hypothetical protein